MTAEMVALTVLAVVLVAVVNGVRAAWRPLLVSGVATKQSDYPYGKGDPGPLTTTTVRK